jgi:hypothetical protein
MTPAQIKRKQIYWANPEKARAATRAWCLANPKKKQLTDRRWRKENRQKASAGTHRWCLENPERAKAIKNRWRKANAEQAAAAVRRWHKDHPEKSSEFKHRRRAREAGNGGDHTSRQWEDLRMWCGDICLGCRRTEKELNVFGLKIVRDHIIPIALGGTNNIDNIQPLCHGKGGCNNRKGTADTDFR